MVVVYAVLGKRGEVTLPEQAIEETLAQPGDLIEINVTGPHTIELTVVMAPRLEEQGIDWSTVNDPLTADVVIPRLTLAEALERFRVDDTIDVNAELAGWQDEAAKDVFGERPERWRR